MSIDGETFARYAKAERDLCQKAGAALIEIIDEIQESYGIKIAEVRVTVDPSDFSNGWPAANCVMVKEHQGCASDRAPLNVEHSASSCARAEHCFILESSA